jgi:hypothetical protein
MKVILKSYKKELKAFLKWFSIKDLTNYSKITKK